MRTHQVVFRSVCWLGMAGLLLLGSARPAAALGGGPPSHSVVPREGTFGVDDHYRPKDFAIIKSGSDYHVYYIRHDNTEPNPNEVTFGHWRSSGNLNSWVQRANISLPLPGGQTWNATGIWAPSVVLQGGTWYMYFTGVDNGSVQRIGLATSTDLDNWSALQDPIYQCVASPHAPPWANCGSNQFRDAFVFPDPRPVGGTDTPGWLMVYSAKPDISVVPNSISNDYLVGLAQTGPQHSGGPNVLLGPWTDAGYIPQTLSATTGSTLCESAHVFYHGSYWYMIHTGNNDEANALQLYTRNSASNSFGTDNWVYRGRLGAMLGMQTLLWYASEYYKDPVTGFEYLGTVHQSLDNLPSGDASVIDFRRIVWGADWQFSLVDPNPPHQLTQWAQTFPASPPSARQQSSMAYDGPNRRMIVFGGTTASAPQNDVWSLSLTAEPTWSQVTTAGAPPSARRAASAVYDSIGRALYVFGGYASTTSLGTPLHDLYKLTLPASGTPQWTQLSSIPGYISNYGTGMVYVRMLNHPPHTTQDRIIVVDGTGVVWNYAVETNTWTNIAYGMPGTAGGMNFATAYDPVRDRVLIFGGWLDGPVPSLNNLNGVNAFYLSGANANQWAVLSPTGTPPAGRSLTATVYDTERDQLVVNGGWAQTSGTPTLFSDTWALAFSGSTSAWSPITTTGMLPAARSGAAAAFEEKFDRMITFGGAFSSGVTSLLASLNADAVSPAQVTDFGGTVYCTRIDFTWTDPGDDGLVGPPRAYDLRKNSVAITDANWDASSYVTSGTCLGLGQAELFSLSLGACSARYYYAVKVRDEAFNWSPISNTTWKIGTPCPPPHAICFDDEFARSGPSAAELTLASANPSRDPFTVLLSVPSDQAGTPYHVAIYDLAGRTVHDLDRGRAEAGRMTMTWDLTDGTGVRVHEGMYFLRLNLGARVLTKTLVVMR